MSADKTDLPYKMQVFLDYLDEMGVPYQMHPEFGAVIAADIDGYQVDDLDEDTHYVDFGQYFGVGQ